MPDRGSPRSRTLWLLLAATLACYGIGYPVALWGHSTAGWVLVSLGGPLLLTLGVLTIRRIHGGAGADPSAAVAGSGRPLHRRDQGPGASSDGGGPHEAVEHRRK